MKPTHLCEIRVIFLLLWIFFIVYSNEIKNQILVVLQVRPYDPPHLFTFAKIIAFREKILDNHLVVRISMGNKLLLQI